jgi:hypothetical protein
MTYQFKLPVGNWLKPQHCQWYTCRADKPIADVREAYFRIEEVTGLTPQSFCSSSSDTCITVSKLRLLLELDLFPEPVPSLPEGHEMPVYPTTDEYTGIVVKMLNKVDPDLNIEILPQAKLPMLPFLGFDDQGRHIEFLGYGLLH